MQPQPRQIETGDPSALVGAENNASFEGRELGFNPLITELSGTAPELGAGTLAQTNSPVAVDLVAGTTEPVVVDAADRTDDRVPEQVEIPAETPVSPAEQESAEPVVLSEVWTIRFGSNGAEVTDEALGELVEEVQSWLSQNENYVVVVTGHTDSRGPASYNESLSEQRATEIVNRLAEFVADDRIIISAEGELAPVADNDSEEGRAQNRRVEVHVQER